MTRPSADSLAPLVVLIERDEHHHDHTDALSRAGFRVMSVSTHDATVVRVLNQMPSVVAAELDQSHPKSTFEFVRHFRQHPQARLIPLIVYGHHLRADDIDAAARAGTLWLQLDPSDGARLVAAVQGLMAARKAMPA